MTFRGNSQFDLTNSSPQDYFSDLCSVSTHVNGPTPWLKKFPQFFSSFQFHLHFTLPIKSFDELRFHRPSLNETPFEAFLSSAMESLSIFSTFIIFLSLCFGLRAFSVMADDEAVTVKVGLVLDSDSSIGKMGVSYMEMALSDFYESHRNYKTRLALFAKNSMEDVIEATAAAIELINKEEVEAIVGPQNSMQAAFMADLGKKSQGVLIHSDDEYGEGFLPSMRDALGETNIRVAYETAIPQSASDDRIAKELYKLMTMQTRVFVVHMLPELGSRLFAMAKEIGMMGSGYVWIITDGMSNFLSRIDDSSMVAMSGALGVRTYIPRTEKLEAFQMRWRRKFEKEISELNIFGLRAYDAIFALAKAVESVGTTEFIFEKSNVSSKFTDLDNLGVSRNGPRLSEALSKTHFKGLAGDFRMVEMKLKSSTYEIINIRHEKNITVVGYWTPENGLTQTLDFMKTNSNTSVTNLSRIIWPGDDPNSFSFPKGWENPTNEKKLRIGIPVKSGVYDAVVGDVSIRESRSLHVDFTFPYSESSVSMVVLFRDIKNKKAWLFLKPLTLDLWLTSAFFFAFIGLVVWILEHRINEDFRGPPSHEIGTSFWFSFSTMVYAQREKVFPKGSQLGRDVSKGILNIMESGVLQEIEDKWFKGNISSPDPNSLISTTLGLESFWGLFLVIGAVSSSAIVIALANFLYEHRHVLKLSTISLWKRLLLLLEIFNEKDMSSPALRKKRQDETPEVKDVRFEPHPSPSCDSSYRNGGLSPCNFDDFHGDQNATPSNHHLSRE
uniref:Glutamate receptor n=1 Tax=Cucumis sativus TaxID=3659 RepID=A0A0A0LFU4_CUCSA